MSKRAPDEFAVVRRAPLIVPPDYDLRPPDPGAPRPNIGTTSDQARVAMTGSQAEPSAAAQVLAGATPPATGQAVTGQRHRRHAGQRDRRRSALGRHQHAEQWRDAAPGDHAGRAAAATAAPPPRPPVRRQAGRARPVARWRWWHSPAATRPIPISGARSPRRIRTLADVEASLFTRIVEWRQPSTLGATIDAPAEAQRLRDNKIAGRAPTDGDTPTVVNRRQSALQGLLEGLF